MKWFFNKADKMRLSLIIPLLSISCVHLPKQLPDDFQFMIQSAAVQPQESEPSGNYSLLIRRKDAKNGYELIRHYGNSNYRLDLKKDQVQRFYDEVRAAKIFNLKNRYDDFDVLDGATTTLTITAHGKTKIIAMRNTQPEELKGVSSILSEFEVKSNQ